MPLRTSNASPNASPNASLHMAAATTQQLTWSLTVYAAARRLGLLGPRVAEGRKKEKGREEEGRKKEDSYREDVPLHVWYLGPDLSEGTIN